MTLFGIDISHHQNGHPDLARARDEDGIQFVFIKATEGADFVDVDYRVNLSRTRSAGLLPAAYHYVRSDASAAAQVANVQRTVTTDVPVILDVESNSGGVSLTREVVSRLRGVGYRVPLLYLPRWYWQQLGSPSLAGLPPLWSSRYPDTVIGDIEDEWAGTPASYWNGYGGLAVVVLQFTSSARVAGYAPLDANAFQGTRDQLAELLGYPTDGDREEEENPMRNLRLARQAGGTAVWVGDGLTRRWVADEAELSGLQYWIEQAGGDPTVVPDWQDLRVLGVDVTSVNDELTALQNGVVARGTEHTGLASTLATIAADVDALLARPIADVDEAALAAELEARGITGVTPQQIKEVVQAVFRDAGTDDAPPATGTGA